MRTPCSSSSATMVSEACTTALPPPNPLRPGCRLCIRTVSVASDREGRVSRAACRIPNQSASEQPLRPCGSRFDRCAALLPRALADERRVPLPLLCHRPRLDSLRRRAQCQQREPTTQAQALRLRRGRHSPPLRFSLHLCDASHRSRAAPRGFVWWEQIVPEEGELPAVQTAPGAMATRRHIIGDVLFASPNTVRRSVYLHICDHI